MPGSLKICSLSRPGCHRGLDPLQWGDRAPPPDLAWQPPGPGLLTGMPRAPHLAQCKAHQGTAPWVNLAVASPPFTKGHGAPPPRLIWWQPRPCPQPRGLRASQPALAWMLQGSQHYRGVQKSASCFSLTLTRILPLTRGVWGPPSPQPNGLHGPAHREYLGPHRQFRLVATLIPTTKLGPMTAGTGGGRTLPSAEGARGLTPLVSPSGCQGPKIHWKDPRP